MWSPIYTPDHNIELHQLDLDHIGEIIDMWADRYRELGAKKDIDYVFIFENRGRAIGVTLDHPHGQLYAFTFIPRKIQGELDSSKHYMEKRKECLFCTILQKERTDGQRIVYDNHSFTAFIPFHATWPFGVHIYSNNHLQNYDNAYTIYTISK